jgi:hypothetical protein
MGHAAALDINDAPAEVSQAGINPQNPHPLPLLCCFFDALARKANKGQWESADPPAGLQDAAMQHYVRFRRFRHQKRQKTCPNYALFYWISGAAAPMHKSHKTYAFLLSCAGIKGKLCAAAERGP